MQRDGRPGRKEGSPQKRTAGPSSFSVVVVAAVVGRRAILSVHPSHSLLETRPRFSLLLRCLIQGYLVVEPAVLRLSLLVVGYATDTKKERQKNRTKGGEGRGGVGVHSMWVGRCEWSRERERRRREREYITRTTKAVENEMGISFLSFFSWGANDMGAVLPMSKKYNRAVLAKRFGTRLTGQVSSWAGWGNLERLQGGGGRG